MGAGRDVEGGAQALEDYLGLGESLKFLGPLKPPPLRTP